MRSAANFLLPGVGGGDRGASADQPTVPRAAAFTFAKVADHVQVHGGEDCATWRLPDNAVDGHMRPARAGYRGSRSAPLDDLQEGSGPQGVEPTADTHGLLQAIQDGDEHIVWQAQNHGVCGPCA